MTDRMIEIDMEEEFQEWLSRQPRKTVQTEKGGQQMSDHVTEQEATSKPFVQLTGRDGNAFSIIASCKRAAKKAGWSAEQWESVSVEMQSGDYDNLLYVAMREFDVA